MRLCVSLILILLCSLAFTTTDIPKCCRRQTCSCEVINLLRGTGSHAAGILTLGKRKTNAPFQSRLYHLLHGLEKQAGGILTMGKREEPSVILSAGGIPGEARICRNVTSLLEKHFSWAGKVDLQTYTETQLANKGLDPRECLAQLLKLCFNSSHTVTT
ncbi:orexin-like [Scyliorhinus canicula]|uniref:orexin-like n=1 Tax=Scyliorhinus canicula TaxID=7830 RepID=UPI0018F78DA4|nr:orexin-like [Scyliorhinus canicula]